MPRLVFEVLHGSWHADGEEFPAGEHVVAKASKSLVTLASHAHAAGALDVTEGLDLKTVQSQKDGEKALAEAMGEHQVIDNPDGTRTSVWVDKDGEPSPWYQGQLAQAALEEEQRGTATVSVDVEDTDQ